MLDYPDLEADLSNEERMILETARMFVQKTIQPDIHEHWLAGSFPTKLVPKMGELGFYALKADYSPMRHMANMETAYTYEGTRDIHTLILGQDLTGIATYE